MPCQTNCGCGNYGSNNCTWIIILAFIIIWFSCGNRGGLLGGCGCANGCNGCTTC